MRWAWHGAMPKRVNCFLVERQQRPQYEDFAQAAVSKLLCARDSVIECSFGYFVSLSTKNKSGEGSPCLVFFCFFSLTRKKRKNKIFSTFFCLVTKETKRQGKTILHPLLNFHRNTNEVNISAPPTC